MPTRVWLLLLAVVAVVPTFAFVQTTDAVQSQTRAVNRQGCFDHYLNVIIQNAPQPKGEPPVIVAAVAGLRTLDQGDRPCRGLTLP